MNHNPKAAFNSKFVTENGGFRSVFATWPNLPNLFPAYTISYSAATGKPIGNGKKKLFVLLVLLLLLISSLAASLVLAFLWFNAIQSDYNPNDAVKIATNLDQNSLIAANKHHVRPSNSGSHKSANLSPDHIDSHLNNHNPNNNPNSNLNGRLSANSRPNGHHSTAPHPTGSHSVRNQATNRRPPSAGHPASPVNERFKPVNHYQQPPARTTSTTPASTTAEAVESANDDDGFGETSSDAPALSNSNAQPPTADKDDERLINYYKNFKNELDRDRSNKIRHEEKLDGEFVEHHTVSDVPDDESDTRELLLPESGTNNNDSPRNEPPANPIAGSTEDYPRTESLYLPDPLASLRTRQFCNPNAYRMGASLRNTSYECRSNPNPALISSYFCNDKFVIVAKINALRETAIGQAAGPNERQLLSKYDVHIERILKRSPFLSVAFKKQGLTTNITLDIGLLSEELQTSGTTTCFGQPLELKPGQTWLLSGKISGLSAVSNNCDLQIDWLNDLDDEQRNQLVNWSASRTTFAHC